MENTCVLDVLPVIPNWKIYNFPTKKDVQYCLIFKRKREFQSLIENALGQKYLIKKKCFIVDKQAQASNDNKSIDIVFLNKAEINYTLSLNLSVLEKYALRRQNNLIVFLKNYTKDVSYQIQKDNIYIKCDTKIQWEMFYNLFEFLLLKYSTSIIGAVFYNSLISGYILKKDKLFMHLIVMEFRSPLHSNFKFNQLKRTSEFVAKGINNVKKKKVNISNCDEQCFNEISIPLLSQKLECKILSNSILKKRALIDESPLSPNSPKHKVRKLNSCFCEKVSCKCHETEWKVFRNIQKYKINEYMDILLAKGVLTEVHSPQESENSIYDPLLIPKSDLSLPINNENSMLVNNTEKKSLQTPYDNAILTDIDDSKQILNSKISDELVESEKSIPSTAITCDKETHQHNFNSNLNPLINPSHNNTKGRENVSLFFDDIVKNSNDHAKGLSMFQTASGKKVSISETALKTVEKMFAEVLESDETYAFEDKNLATVEQKSAIKKNDFKNVRKTPLKTKTSKDLVDENYTGECIDSALAEKIFEEISFDEKDVENCFIPSSSVVGNSYDRTSSSGKVRKSLGVRRSLKPYSVQKS